MIPNVISNPGIAIRANQFKREMERQGVQEYKLWPSINIADKPRRTGISKAHKQIVEWALLEGIPEVCIMEDDVWFPANDGYEYFLSKKPKQYDLYLGGITRGEIKDGIVKRYTGQFCYFIHERYYTTFLSTDENLDIDGGQSGRGEFHVCEPFACFCYPTHSENIGGMMCYAHLLVGREIHGFGTINNQTDSKTFSNQARSLMLS